MSLSSRVSAVVERIGLELKTANAAINSKYTKPSTGIPAEDLTDSTRKMLKVASRWEQEILVQAGTRVVGFGLAPLGIHIPFQIKLQGVRYHFQTPTTTGATQGILTLDGAYNLSGSAQMNVAAGDSVQNIVGLNIMVPAGSRLSLNVTDIGSGTVGKGIYMSLWGEYDLNAVTL